MEQDPEYRRAVIDEGYDPDDPHTRRAIAGVVALLRGVADAERAAHHEVDDTGAAQAADPIDALGAHSYELERQRAAAGRESVDAGY